MMILTEDLFGPITAIAEAGMGVELADPDAPPHPWTAIQGWTRGTRSGHAFLILDYDAPTDRVLTLESNSAHGLDGVGFRKLGNLAAQPEQTPTQGLVDPRSDADLGEVLPAGTTLPEGLIDFVRSENLVWANDSCGAKRYCAAIHVELDGEAPKEWVLVVHRRSWAQALAIAETDTGFRSLGVLQPTEGGANPGELEASLKASDFGTETSRFRDFRIGEALYRVVPN